MKQRESGLPFDDLRNLVESLPTASNEIAEHTANRLVSELGDTSGRTNEICEWYSRWSGRSPIIHRPLVALFAGTHKLQNRLDDGKAAEMLLNAVTRISEGDAVVNRLCNLHNHGLKFFDLALQMPVSDISAEPALDEKGCAGTIAFGMEAIAGGSDLLTLCAVSSGTDLSSIAILSVLHGQDPGPFLEPEIQGVEYLRKAVDLALPHKSNPLEVLRRLGGRETAAICGAILSARTERVPTVVGGVVGLAACAVLGALNEDAVQHCVFANKFDSELLNAVLSDLKIQTVLDCSLSSLEEANAVIASSVVQSACKHFPAIDQATSVSD